MSFLSGGKRADAPPKIGEDPASKGTLDKLTGSGNEASASGKQAVGAGLEAFKMPTDFWKKILSGDPAVTQEVLAPEQEKIVSQYDAAKQSIAQNSPRGGQMATALSDMPVRAAGDLNRLRENLIPQAAGALASIGGAEAGIGANLMGTGMRGYEDVLQALVTGRGQDIPLTELQWQQQFQKQQQLGQGFGEIMAMMMMG